jgi:hypothetical protein
MAMMVLHSFFTRFRLFYGGFFFRFKAKSLAFLSETFGSDMFELCVSLQIASSINIYLYS